MVVMSLGIHYDVAGYGGHKLWYDVIYYGMMSFNMV